MSTKYPIEIPTEHGLYESERYKIIEGDPYSPKPYRLDEVGFYLTAVEDGEYVNSIRIDGETRVKGMGPFRLIKSEEVAAPVVTNIQVGDMVRILPSYGKLWEEDERSMGETKPGAKFVVTQVISSEWKRGNDGGFTFHVMGDAEGRGVWDEYIEKVEPKMFSHTVVSARSYWGHEGRIVRVASGNKLVSLGFAEDWGSQRDIGAVSVTPDEAEELANDLLERAAEIHAMAKKEDGK